MSDHVSQNVIIWALLSTVTSCIFLDTPACHNWGVEVSPQFWHCGDFETHYISTEPNLSKVLIHTQAKGAWPFKGWRLVLRKSSSTAETNAMFAPRLISKVTCSQISEKYRIQSNIRKVQNKMFRSFEAVWASIWFMVSRIRLLLALVMVR